MKAIISVCIFWAFFGLLSLNAQPVNHLINDVSMSAPTPTSLTKYSDIPVSYFTGVPNISIPIYTVKEGPISLPITLNYHSSGVKVAEMASWVGLGWSLNAGGLISRTVQGLPDDETSTGYYHNGANVTTSLSMVEDVTEGLVDSEPDIFSFNFSGFSGKFFFDKDKKCHFIPKQDLKMEVELFSTNGPIEKMTITSTDGTRYIFSAIERTVVDSDSYATGWHLTKIESHDQKYSIDLTYASQNYSYDVARTAKKIKYTAERGLCTENNGNGEIIYSIPKDQPYGATYLAEIAGGKRLSIITSSTVTIDFKANTQREDMGSTNKRLDAIEITSGTFCKKFKFTYDIFKDNSCNDAECKRLQLQEVQEFSCDETVSIEPYVFEYEGTVLSGKIFLPKRSSKAFDHWGFYNGASGNNSLSVNAPSTSVSFGAGTFTFGSANRNTVESEMKKGVLKKITYPTGGNTQFTYEANTYPEWEVVSTTDTYLITDLSNCTSPATKPSCCTGYDLSGSEQATISNPVSEYYFDLSLFGDDPSCPSSGFPTPEVEIEVRKLDNSIVGTYSYNVNYGSYGHQLEVPLTSISSSITSSNTYKFRLLVYNGVAEFSLYRKEDVYGWVNKKVGGLRIKEIKSHDGFDTQKDIIKTYEYTDASVSTKSSGKLLQIPKYGYSNDYSNGGTDNAEFAVIEEVGVVPTSDFQGYHIGYERVIENHNGNGKSIYTYETETSSHGTAYPYPPALATVNNGQLKNKAHLNSGSTTVAETTIAPLSESYTNGAGTVYKAFRVPVPEISCGVNPPLKFFEYPTYVPRTKPYRIDSKVEMRDGVSTTTEYTYGSSEHLAPTAIVMTNSDNTIFTTQLKYVHDWSSSTLKTKMIARNMIGSPVETTVKVGNDILNGTKIEYSFFDVNGDPITQSGEFAAYPYRFYNYERTWTGGTLQSGSWVLQGTVNKYYEDSNTNAKGYPKEFTRENWQKETYEWNKGLITKRTFKDFNWIYAYETGTRLLKSMTDVDGQVVNYAYDKLMRLKTVTARGGNVETNYTYKFQDGSVARNYIKAVTEYTAVTGSNLTEKGSVQYFDGLGRLIQESKIKYHPIKGQNGASYGMVDVLTQYEYDNQGRLIKQSLPFASPTNSTDGSYQTAPGGLEYSISAYESSPLNRVTSTTPPDWYATTFSYGKNTSSITIPGTSTSYPSGTLFETKTTDPDNRVTKTYTDRKGRLILTEQTNTSGTTPAKTYNDYDDKDRLIMVIPPDATASSSNLIYTYEYSGDNLLLKKKIPGAGEMNMKYNNRDLLTFHQDPNRLAASESIGTKYDDYGRPTETGFVSGLPSDPDAAFSFTTLLTKNFYDGYDGTSQLNLTTYPQYRGKARRSEARVLDGGSTFLHTTFTYDTHGRIASTAGNNYLNSGSGTAETVSLTYDWADNVIIEDRTHNPGSGATTGSQAVKFKWDYDHMGRSINLYFFLNSPSNTHLAEYNYNNRDELIERNLHSNYQSGLWAWWQSVDYSYNDLGWLTKINSNTHVGTSKAFPTGCSPTLPNPGSPTRVRYPEDNDLFYLELRYDELFSSSTSGGNISGMSGTVQKAGNISQLAWRTRGRDRQAYSFSYDYLSRLSTSTYYDVVSAGTASTTNRYNENLSYDLRGNISSLQRNGYYSSTCNYGQIDNLTYTYASGTNQLSSISDSAPFSQKMHGFDTGSGGSGYTYDANGNLKSDSYKGISNITYNYLNLPDLITFSSGNSIEYVYDASGIKLRKIVKVGASTQYQQDYIGGLEYRKTGTGSRRIEAIYHDEGRYFNLNVEVNNTLHWQKEYAIRDHLGNTRLMFTDKNGNNIIDVTNNASTNDILQENHYYPFGLGFEGPWLMDDAGRDNQYRYNSKELNEDFGLNWYAYGARYYDPTLGRFTGVDPIADEFPWVSTYNYAENEPIAHIDLHGLQKVSINDIKNDKGVIIKRNVRISANVKVLNLSSKENYSFNRSLNEASSIARRIFSGTFNSTVLSDSKNGKITSYEVPIDVTFQMSVFQISSIKQITSTDLASIIVDEIDPDNSKDVAGIAEVSTNISLLVADYMTGISPEVLLHELGHNFSLDHTKDGKGLMGEFVNGQTHISNEELKMIGQALGAHGSSEGRIHDIPDIIKNLINFLKENTNSTGRYDKQKAKSAGIN